jgi:hypothetical protein
MAVYVDRLRDWGWELGPSCHMVADTNLELHEMALKIGLKRRHFQARLSGPHYDLTARRRALAVRYGAVELTGRALMEILRAWRKAAYARLAACKSEQEVRVVKKDLFR